MNNSAEARKLQINNQAFIHSVITKANQDEAFKANLLADPDATLKAFNPKYSRPSGFEVVVEDQPQLNTIYFDFVQSEDLELTEEELETVSGGTSVLIIGCIVTRTSA